MNLSYLGITLLVVVVAIVAAMTWQHSRYLEKRRTLVQDNQSVFHGDVLHVVTYLRTDLEIELLPALTRLKSAAENTGDSQLIYAGKVIYNGLQSSQLTETLGGAAAWDAIVLQQFDDRAGYDNYLQDEAVQAALETFEIRYTHGMKRSMLVNLLLPQFLLVRKLQGIITFSPVEPLEPADLEGELEFRDIGDPLMAAAEDLGKDAIVIVNLISEGTALEQAANADYGGQMLGRMAAKGHGPMHIGSAVSLEAGPDYDNVAMVYYPGSRYFRDLVTSAWFQGIIGNKQLADTQATITVPVTHRI